jgi:digeranylgeranylglycerophospholipid reductase
MDVAIVGGGPAGLLVAERCAEAGLDVLVFEEHPTIGEPTHCTGIVSLETAELAKIPDEAILARLSRARLHGPGGATHEFAWDPGAGEQILSVDRAAFDAVLAQRAADAGAVFRTGVRVTEVCVEADAVEVLTGETRVRARACVLACGVSYRLQRRLGFGVPAQLVQTAQLEVDGTADEHVDVYFGRAVAPEGFGWVVPLSRGGRERVKVGVMASADAGAALELLLARPDVGHRLRAQPGPALRRLLPLTRIEQTYGDRVLVVGDAGGFTKPTTGGGIFYSLLTASLAAETLVEAFQDGRLDAAGLARYERRWQERLGRELQVAGWVREVASRLDDDEIDRLLEALAQNDVQAVIRGTARFNWHAEVIVTLARRGGLVRLLLRALLR